jgi:hypothetical protein
VVYFGLIQFNDHNSMWLELILIQFCINAQGTKTSLRDDGDTHWLLHYLFGDLPTLPTASGHPNRARLGLADKKDFTDAIFTGRKNRAFGAQGCRPNGHCPA